MTGNRYQFLPAKQQASRHAGATLPVDAIACLPTGSGARTRKGAIFLVLVDNSFDIHRISCEQVRTCPRTRILYRFAPEKIQGLCSAYFCRKRLIARINSELSTDISAFTTTTIFIYKPIVERPKKPPSAVFSRKAGKTGGVKKNFENRLPEPSKPARPVFALKTACRCRTGPGRRPVRDEIFGGQRLQTCWLSIKNALFARPLWISACISTGSVVGKLAFYAQAIFYPKLILSGYNVYAVTFLDAKSMILRLLTDLSTKKPAFTITTIFIYKPYIKQPDNAAQCTNQAKTAIAASRTGKNEKKSMKSSKKMRLGVISALSEEQEGLVEAMQGPHTLSYGMRDWTTGSLWGIDAVCVLSRIGKVAATMTAAILVEKFEVTHIVFTGVAGSADVGVKVGDLVVADMLIQHDIDARPLFPRFEVPLTGLARFASDRALSDRLAESARSFLLNDFKSVISEAEAREFGLDQPQLHRGLIGSGDQFIHNRAHLHLLKEALPDLLAVEMEGAAVAQLCFELGIPFTVIRTISDNANEDAAIDFMHFVRTVASRYAFHVVKRLCEREQDCAALPA